MPFKREDSLLAMLFFTFIFECTFFVKWFNKNVNLCQLIYKILNNIQDVYRYQTHYNLTPSLKTSIDKIKTSCKYSYYTISFKLIKVYLISLVISNLFTKRYKSIEALMLRSMTKVFYKIQNKFEKNYTNKISKKLPNITSIISTYLVLKWSYLSRE